MKRSILSISLLLILAAAVLAVGISSTETSATAKQYELKYKMAKGTKFVMSSEGSLESITDQMGTEVVADITGTSSDIYAVLETGDGLTLEMEYGERTQNVESAQGSMSTDYSELVGKKVKFVLKPNGEVTGYEGFDALPEITTASQETLTADLYQLGAKGTFTRLPDKPVTIGDTWTHDETNEIPVEGNVIISTSSTTYKVVEETQKDGFNCLKIEFASKDKLEGTFQQGGMDLAMDRETNTKGTLYFAYEEGMFVFSEAEGKGEGVITVEQAGVDIPQTLNSKGTVTVKITK